jgi:hypothetical protein
MKIGIAKALTGDPVHCRGRYHAAEGAWRPKPDIVGHDEQHVWCPRGRRNARWSIRRGLGCLKFDLASELWRRRRQLCAVDRRRS